MSCCSGKFAGMLILTFALVLTTFSPSAVSADHSDHPCMRTCVSGEKMTCHYNFTVEWYQTLSKACFECPFNLTDCYREDCVAADGKVRAVLSINRQIPGPSIRVCEGDEVVVSVTNMLEDGLSTSIHWHGQHVSGTPYMDGVGQVTQCHIQHQETFHYRFEASPAGSHWYHAHTGMQLADGLFGAFIVRQPPSADPSSILYDHDLPEHEILLYDWLPELAMTRYVFLMHQLFDISLPRNVLVNGRGRGYNVTDPYNLVESAVTAQTPLEVLHVQKDRKYRLRFVSAAPLCPLQVSVDEHQLIVIAVDGMPLEPRTVDAFIVHPGARYDFVLDASKEVGNYWLRALGLGECEFSRVTGDGYAILRYKDAPEGEEPSGDPTLQRDGILLNPILYDQNKTVYGFNRTTIRADDMRFAGEGNYTEEVVDFKYFVGMDFNNNDHTKYNKKELYPIESLHPRKNHFTPVMDNITFMLPPTPLLSQPEDVRESWFCNRSTIEDPEYCLTEDLCMCTHLLRVKLNQVVELIVFHEGRFFVETGHNVHLHGHSFRLLGVGKVGPSVSRSQLEDMDARGELRRNLIKPPFRDTITIPDGGYAVIRFTASNPGFWFFHCHTDSHLQQGMALLLKIGDYSDFPKVPEEFPRCGGMGFSNARKRQPPQTPKPPTGAASKLRPAYWLVLTLIFFVFFLF